MKNIGVLHVITDTTHQSRYSHPQLTELAIKGGADTVQFRHKNGTTRELVEIAQEMQNICSDEAVPLIVNDRTDIALAVEANGVHFGQDDMPVSIGRRIMSLETIIGASARSEEKILKAITEGADYIGFGPIFRTSSKADAEKPKGLGQLERMCDIAECPVIAIGGITLETTRDVIRAGAHGIAVISAVCSQINPQEATQKLIQEIHQAK
ncbi:thiamine phosphate synthase [Candidatus Poribacteria bacterium]|nr:thiamine phosphate synthase [Candidatus Poribacteria bacterium]